MNDDEYIIDIVYNANENKMLQKLAYAYNKKFYNNLEIKNTLIQYAVSSYLEPECFPFRTPIEEIPDLITSDTLFINQIINKLSETNDLHVLIPDLINVIYNKINIIPDDTINIYYFQLQTLFNNKNVLLYYADNNFPSLQSLFKPRLCPDINNILMLPKEKETLFSITKYFDILHIKISEIILLFCKCKETRSKMVNYLYSFVEKNKGRKKTITDNKCDVDGILLNFLGSMLLLCDPFISIHSDKVKKINLEESNNFISQCFEITCNLIDYGFLTTLENYKICQFRNNNTNNEYLVHSFESQIFNKVLLHNLKKFNLLQLHVIYIDKIKDEIMIESIWKTVECLFYLNLLDYDIINYIIKYYIELEDITNPHLRCEVGRITASTLTLKVILPEEKIMKKLLTLYGNLPNVDTQNQFLCRKEIAKCIDLYDITHMDEKILSDFCYAILCEVDTQTSCALDELIKLKIKIDNNEEIEEKFKEELSIKFNFANDTLLFLKKISQLIPKAFNDECSIKKTASAWSFMIYRLIGPQSLKLKIQIIITFIQKKCYLMHYLYLLI